MILRLPEAKNSFISLKIKNFQNKSGLGFALRRKISEKNFTVTSTSRKLRTAAIRQVRGEFGVIFCVKNRDMSGT